MDNPALDTATPSTRLKILGDMTFLAVCAGLFYLLNYYELIYREKFYINAESLPVLFGGLASGAWYFGVRKRPVHENLRTFQGILATVVMFILFSAMHLFAWDMARRLFWVYALLGAGISFWAVKVILVEGRLAWGGLLALLFFSWNPYQNEKAHEAAYLDYLAILLLVWSFGRLRMKFWKQRVLAGTFLPYTLFFCILLISTLNSVYPYRGFQCLGWYARYGAILLLAGTAVRTARDVVTLSRLLVFEGAVLSAVALGLLGERAWHLGLREGLEFRVWPLNSPPNYAVFVVLLALPLALWLFLRPEHEEIPVASTGEKILLALAIGLQYAFVFFSYARSSFFILLLQIPLLLGAFALRKYGSRLNLQKATAWGLAAVFCLAAAGFLAPPAIKGRFAESLQFLQSHRMRIWKTILPLAKDYPWFGPGPETKRYLLNIYSVRSGFGGTQQYFKDAHNTFLEWLTSGGVAGLVAGFILYLFSLRRLWALFRRGPPFAAGLAAACAAGWFAVYLDGLVNYRLWVYENGHLLFVLIALPWLIPGGERVRDPEPLSRKAGIPLAVGILAFLCFGATTHIANLYVQHAQQVLMSDPPSAKISVERAAMIQPLNAHIFFLLSNWYSINGQKGPAIAAARHAVGLNSYFGLYHHQLARVLAEAGRFPEAIAEYGEATSREFYQGSGEFQRNAGELEYYLGHRDSAARHLAWSILFKSSNMSSRPFQDDPGFQKQVLEVMEEYASKGSSEIQGEPPEWFHERLIRALIDGKFFDRAEALLRMNLATDPENAWASIELGRMLTVQKRYEEGEKLLRAAISLDPVSGVPSTDLGVNLFYQGRLQEAVKELREGIRKKTSLTIDPYVDHIYLAQALKKLGDEAGAAEEQAKAAFIRSDLPHQTWDTNLHSEGADWELQQYHFYAP